MAPVLETRDLKRHYTMGDSTVRALDGVTLQVNPGDFLALVGTSGSGKSTLLNLIAGLDRPTAGSLKVFDSDLSAMSREELSVHRRKNVGLIFQSFNLIATMSALENVALALVFAGALPEARESRARTLLESVGLAARERHRPSELSGGEQQRVAIARALANDPEILLADEPTGNLDSRTSREILDLIGGLNTTAKKTIIMVTHDAHLASRYVSRTVTLSDGRIVNEGDE